METQVGASRLTLAAFEFRSRDVVFCKATNRLNLSKCSKKNFALSMVLKVSACLVCGLELQETAQ